MAKAGKILYGVMDFPFYGKATWGARIVSGDTDYLDDQIVDSVEIGKACCQAHHDSLQVIKEIKPRGTIDVQAD